MAHSIYVKIIFDVCQRSDSKAIKEILVTNEILIEHGEGNAAIKDLLFAYSKIIAYITNQYRFRHPDCFLDYSKKPEYIGSRNIPKRVPDKILANAKMWIEEEKIKTMLIPTDYHAKEIIRRVAGWEQN